MSQVAPANRLATTGTRLPVRHAPLAVMYHAVDHVDADPYHLAVSPERFDTQLGTLRRLGLRGVSITELVAALRAGRARGLVGLSFDDGYTGVLRYAMPALHRHGFNATVFVVADRLGGCNDWDTGPVWPLLDAAGVRELDATGVEIGSHGATHVRLAGLSPDRLRYELRTSRERLGDLLGQPPEGFAYPYGSVDAAAVEAVRDAGYTYACAVDPPRSAVSVLTLPRSYVGERDGPLRLTAKWALHRVRAVLRGGSL